MTTAQSATLAAQVGQPTSWVNAAVAGTSAPDKDQIINALITLWLMAETALAVCQSQHPQIATPVEPNAG